MPFPQALRSCKQLTGGSSISTLTSFQKIHENSEPVSGHSLMHGLYSKQSVPFLTLAMKSKQEGRVGPQLKNQNKTRGRHKFTSLRGCLEPARRSLEKQGHGPCPPGFSIISGKMCKPVSSHRSSDILGALLRIILKAYNQIIERLARQRAAAKALGK